MRFKLLVAGCFLWFCTTAFSQQFGTILVSDYDDVTASVEDVSVFLGDELLGKTNHLGQFDLPRKVKGTLTLSRTGYQSQEVRFKSKKDVSLDVYLQVVQQQYDQKRFDAEKLIYATCVPENVETLYPANKQDETMTAAVNTYFESYMRYPKRAIANKEQGTVRAMVLIEADGTISCIQLINRISFELDQEAYRLLSMMPDWIPARKNGSAVSSSYEISVPFVLPK
ncbi:MAG TPA: energy transducer TonB [Fluviicola sp.]|nr:energy transducer TonB [Fluviicola sp.]